ncbi:MAG: hypothetical protein OEV94_04540 [Deltaproteobacteria bacterium]|nr:hypothetical protein [Deltaproteobacteria bacterium]
MKPIESSDISRLEAREGGPCVSLYMNSPNGGQDPAWTPLKLAELFRRMTRGLALLGMTPAEARRMVTRIENVLTDLRKESSPWPGVCLFASPGGLEAFWMFQAAPPEVVMENHFHLRPVMTYLKEYPAFALLTLSRNRVGFYLADAAGIQRELVDDMPESLAETRRFISTERHMLHQPAAGGTLFHGHATHEENPVKAIDFFIHRVEKAVTARLDRMGMPLVLAGSRELTAMYRRHNRYPGLCDQAILGNPRAMTTAARWEKGRRMAQAHMDQLAEATLHRMGHMRNQGRIKRGGRSVLVAAQQGRVESLLVDSGATLWGAMDPATGTIQPHAEPHTGDTDLIEAAARETMAHHGKVFWMAPHSMDAPMTALTRY